MPPAIMLRLDVEAMRYQVVHAFADHSVEIQEAIGAEVEQALKSLDFSALVREVAQRELRKAVSDAVAHAASSICWDREVSAILKAGAAKKVRQAIVESLGVEE